MHHLTDPEIYDFVDHYESWEYTDGKLVATYEFEDFWESISFVNDLAEIAESQQHHPDITISYNKVTLACCTHDLENIITSKDITLIEAIETIIE